MAVPDIPDTPQARVSREGRARFEEFLQTLQHRSPVSLKVLHVLRNSDGFLCVDLNVSGKTVETFEIAAGIALRRLSPDTELPVINRERWWEFWCGDFIGRGAITVQGSLRERYLLMIRGVKQEGDQEWVYLGEG